MKGLLDDTSSYLHSLVFNLNNMKIDNQELTSIDSVKAQGGMSSRQTVGGSNLIKIAKPSLLLIYVAGETTVEELTSLQNIKERDFDIIAGGWGLEGGIEATLKRELDIDTVQRMYREDCLFENDEI